jgi:hypothetical protein
VAGARVAAARPSGCARPDEKHSTMLRYATLRYATLRYATLCYAMLCYAMLCYAMLCYAMLCYAMLCYAAHPDEKSLAGSSSQCSLK